MARLAILRSYWRQEVYTLNTRNACLFAAAFCWLPIWIAEGRATGRLFDNVDCKAAACHQVWPF